MSSILKCLQWPFCPGVFIAILAVVAATVTFWENPPKWFKALSIGVFLLLMVGEVAMMSLDRERNDKAQQAATQLAEDNFTEIASGITASIADSDRKFKATMGRTNQVLDNITGGKSFGYIVPQWDGTLIFHNEGPALLSGASINITHAFNRLYDPITLGNVAPYGIAFLPNITLLPKLSTTSGLDAFVIEITAANGLFTEVLTFRVARDGRPFAYMFEVTKYIELCRPTKHLTGSSLVDCPKGISTNKILYIRSWSDEPPIPWPPPHQK